MAYYYVKDDGTAESGTATGDGGRYTTQKTGDWTDAFSATTEYYASIGAALGATTDPTDGDFVLVSNLHDKAYDNGTPPILNDTGTLGEVGLQTLSVDDTAIDEYKPGAVEELTDTDDDYTPQFNNLVAGISLKTGDNVFYMNAIDSILRISDSIINVSGNGDMGVYLNQPGVSAILVNTEINIGNSGAFALAMNEGSIVWEGGSLTGTAPIQLFFRLSVAGTSFVHIRGVDLSGFTGQLVPNSATSVEQFIFKLTDCILNSGVTLYGTLTQQFHRFEMYNCDVTTGVQHRFEIADGTGVAVHNDSIYVTANDAWYGGTDKSSIAVTTTAKCSEVIPFVFELPAQYVDLSNAASDVITLDIVTDTALTAGDIAVFLVYPDSADKITSNWVSSTNAGSGDYGHDPLTTAAIPNTSPAPLAAGDWTGEDTLTSPLYYRLNLDTSTDAGEETAVSIRIEVYKASITDPIYINPIIRLS